MAFFSGPSKDVMFGMAQGIASYAMQIRGLDHLDAGSREQILQSMRAAGAPTTIEELVTGAASVVAEQNMGWLKKNQFLGAIHGYLTRMGMSNSDAWYLKGLIEIRMQNLKQGFRFDR